MSASTHLSPGQRASDGTPTPQSLRAEALWPQARRMAARRCHNNLYRLRRGEGGFYGADDFWQDLFLEFWALLERPELAGLTFDDDALRTAWGKALWGGGLRILRRAPQRLWRRFEYVVDPARLDPTGGDDPWSRLSSLPLPAEALVGSDGRLTQERLARVERLERSLARLRPAQRQLLYLTAVRRLPAGQVAQQLRLVSANAVYQRVRAARQQLAQEAQTDG